VFNGPCTALKSTATIRSGNAATVSAAFAAGWNKETQSAAAVARVAGIFIY
jgi:hypothetical protein